VDRTEVWRTARRDAKIAAEITAELASAAGRRTLEAWRTEAARRAEMRRALKPAVRDAQRARNAARRHDPQRLLAETHRAERELAQAKRAVPLPLWVLALEIAAALTLTAVVGLPHVPETAWVWTAVAVSAALIAGLVWLAFAVARRDEKPSELVPTAEEKQLLTRLQPEHWGEHAEARGLAGTLTGRPGLTISGVTVAVRLDGTWTAGKLRGANEHVRALLGCRTDLLMEIKAGTHGGWADLVLRTRSAADGIELTGWAPGDPWGIDTITGELVHVPLGRRMLIAGTSGAGKSWSTRALLAEASERPDHRLVVIDPKRVEAINWQHRARVAITPDDVLELTDELVAEMHERLGLIPRGRDTVAISEELPRITVFVDEGAEVISMSRAKEYRRALENLVTVARMARAAEIILIWATQKPTQDAKGGIDPQISAQITYRAALALSTSAEARTVFGEDATEKGWHAHDLPMPGVAMLRWGPKAKPHPIKTRAFSPADVIALPDRPVWQRELADAPARPALTLVKGGGDYELAPPAAAAPADAVPAPAPAAEGTDAKVLDAVRTLTPPVRQTDVVAATGLPKGTVSKAVKRLVTSGLLVRLDDGTVALPTAKEA
jgi:S-DNA-T family DNA segregation ATPase FtsK/SpoIIIE